jgi:hypothetical protein
MTPTETPDNGNGEEIDTGEIPATEQPDAEPAAPDDDDAG